jgi:2-polyprenyl-6-methoxyphenol hydroxylase-like FAD-dependent oxidoreductase
MSNLGKHAIVIGASMSGLLAARALADFYTTVTVLERDAFPAVDLARKGVPQGRHTHGLLARGSTILEGFFPGYNAEVVARSGGLIGDVANDVIWIGRNVRLANGPSDLIGLLASRPVLEGHLRRRLAALPNVRAIENCAVRGLATDSVRKRVTGVRTCVENKPEETINADLVVDATGRGSSSAAWLEALGYQAPASEKVEIGICYMTRTYRRRPTDLDGKHGIVVAGSAPNWRSGVMLAQENDSWIISTGGFLGDDAPYNDQGFLAYLATLPTMEIHDVVARAEPLTDYRRYRYVSSLRRRYEKLARFPENYLVFGDAICSFNPVYGQGMTSAVLQAKALRRCLANADADDLSGQFFRRAAKIVRPIWLSNRLNDYAVEPADGWRAIPKRLLDWYTSRMMAVAAHDVAVFEAFLRTLHLIDPPNRLMHPALVMRIIVGVRRRSSLHP